jgi:hypothetical protein
MVHRAEQAFRSSSTLGLEDYGVHHGPARLHSGSTWTTSLSYSSRTSVLIRHLLSTQGYAFTPLQSRSLVPKIQRFLGCHTDLTTFSNAWITVELRQPLGVTFPVSPKSFDDLCFTESVC